MTLLSVKRRFFGPLNISQSTFLIALALLWTLWKKLLIERSESQVMQIQCPGLASFGVEHNNTPSSLIDVALI